MVFYNEAFVFFFDFSGAQAQRSLRLIFLFFFFSPVFQLAQNSDFNNIKFANCTIK